MLLLGFRSLARAQEKGKPAAPKAQACRLMGEVSVSPALMGDIAVPQPIRTNTIGGLTNCPGTNGGEMIMGKIALPPRTNSISRPISPK